MKLSKQERRELENLIENSSTPQKKSNRNFNRYVVKGKFKFEDSLLEGDDENIGRIILEKVKSDGKTKRLRLWLKFVMFITLILVFVITNGELPFEYFLDYIREIFSKF